MTPTAEDLQWLGTRRSYESEAEFAVRRERYRRLGYWDARSVYDPDCPVQEAHFAAKRGGVSDPLPTAKAEPAEILSPASQAIVNSVVGEALERSRRVAENRAEAEASAQRAGRAAAAELFADDRPASSKPLRPTDEVGDLAAQISAFAHGRSHAVPLDPTSADPAERLAAEIAAFAPSARAEPAADDVDALAAEIAAFAGARPAPSDAD